MRHVTRGAIVAVAGLLSMFIGLFSVPSHASTIAPPARVARAFTYDTAHHLSAWASTITERAPPSASRRTDYDAADCWSHDALACPAGVTPPAAFAYDPPASPMRVPRAWAMNQGQARVLDRDRPSVPGARSAAETAPLDWSLVSKSGETRAAHVALHEGENASKMAHGVFLGDSQALTNEAWSIAQSRGIAPISEGGVDIYRVPMARNVGYGGGANAWGMAEVPHRTIEIITRGGTNELITAYPVPMG